MCRNCPFKLSFLAIYFKNMIAKFMDTFKG